MGLTESENQNEVLSRCNHRIQFMKAAVTSRNSFANAHSQYASCLQKIRAALSDYVSEGLSCHSSAAAPRVFIPRRLLPPRSFPATLQRTVGLRKIHRQTVKPLSRITVPDMEPQMKLQKTGKLMMSSIQMFQILGDHFLKASRGAHEVSNYADSRGYISYIEENVIVWEEKLYNEVQIYKGLRFDASTSVVNMQSMDPTLALIHTLRDEQLYPKLLQLLDQMATMWETMRHTHESQVGILQALKSLDNFQVQSLENTRGHHLSIMPLFAVVREWYTLFCTLIDCQKDYTRALHNWLSINLAPVESNSPIHELAKAWNDAMDELPDEIARNAIRKFAGAILTIAQRENEMKLREKCDATRLELDCKSMQYEDWCAKNGVNGKLDSENPLEIARGERKSKLISLKQKLEELQEIFRQEREKSLARLTGQSLHLFIAMSETARACSVMYTYLRSVAENSQATQNI